MQCAENLVAFHYSNQAFKRDLYTFIYRSKEREQLVREAL